ncbi:MAG TPA: M48 family metalloprotease [bacterium]|nr:M48 family metalloprotease [bacterium]
MRIRRIHRALRMALAAVLVVAVAPLAAPVRPATAQLFGISEQQEIQIGREVERQMAQKPGFVNDPRQTESVTTLGLKLARASERPNLPWTYHIVRDNTVNSLAAPGGFIFVTQGMMRFVKSEDELAFVLGHETTHVAHRHAVDLAQRDMELQLGAVIVTQILFGGSLGAYELTQLGRALVDAKYSRDKEAEADHYGVIYMRKVGYNPLAALAFFQRLAASEKSQPNAFQHAFEDHPDTPARIAAIQTELHQMGYDVPLPGTPPPTSSAPARTAPPTPPTSAPDISRSTPSVPAPRPRDARP